jgi:hypothetical protein
LATGLDLRAINKQKDCSNTTNKNNKINEKKQTNSSKEKIDQARKRTNKQTSHQSETYKQHAELEKVGEALIVNKIQTQTSQQTSKQMN